MERSGRQTRHAGALVVIMDLDNDLARMTIESSYEKSVEHRNFFNDVEIEEIWKSAFQFAKAKTNRWNKTVFITRDMNHILTRYGEKLSDVLPEPRVQYGGNFFITSIGYGMHTDSYQKSAMKEGGRHVPWRNILIPLWSDGRGGMINYYDARFPTWSVSGTKGAAGQYIKEFDDLSIENQFEWKPGSAFVFDSCQLHDSPTHLGNFSLKMGLLIKFVREVA